MASAARTRRHHLGVTFMAAIMVAAFVANAAQASMEASEAPTTPTETPTAPTETPTAEDAPRTPRPGLMLNRGTFTGFDVPDAQVGTSPIGITNRGVIVGKYNDGAEATGPGASEHGFVRSTQGRFTTVDVPDARSTALTRINDRGQMVGISSTTKGRVGDDPNRSAFLLRRGKVTRIEVPDAVYTQAFGINNDTHVVGEYVDTSGVGHGFLWKNGRFITIDVPESAYTAALDINARGQILGIHVHDLATEPLEVHGFVLDRGRYTTFDAPDVAITYPTGINNRGQIVGGTSNDGANIKSRFVMGKGVDGPFTPIDMPDARNALPSDINDNGTIIGTYANAEHTDTQPPSMMSEMWESMAFVQDLAEHHAEEPEEQSKPERPETKQPEQTRAKPKAKPEAKAKPKTNAKPKAKPEQSKPKNPAAKDRRPAERPRRKAVVRRMAAAPPRVFRTAPATDRNPAPAPEAEVDTSTIFAEPTDDPSEPTGLIQIRVADTDPSQDVDQTSAVSPMTRLTTRGLAVAVGAGLLLMTRRRLRASDLGAG